MDPSDTAIGVFGIIHRLGACERTASSGLESSGWLRSRDDDWSGRSSNHRRLGSLGETILHGCSLSLVRRRADFNDVAMGGSRRGGKLGVGRGASESVSVGSGARGDRRKHGGCSVAKWRRRETTVFYRGGVRHLVLDIIELLLLVVRIEGAWWPTTGDLGIAGLLLEGIRRCRIIARRVRQRGRRATTRAKGSVGRRRGEDDCTRLVRRLSRVTKVVLRVLVHASSIVGDGGRVERAVDHFRITTG